MDMTKNITQIASSTVTLFTITSVCIAPQRMWVSWKLTFTALCWLARMIHPATRFSIENRSHLAGGWPRLNFEKHLWVPGVANFMLPRFRLPRGRLVGKDLFLQARAGTAAPV